MDRHFADFMEEFGRQLDNWMMETSRMVGDPDATRSLSPEERTAFKAVGEALDTNDLSRAFQTVLLYGMTGLLHSITVALDGGTQLADSFTVTLTTSDGYQLAPGTGLNELFIDHLYETGRLPSPAGE